MYENYYFHDISGASSDESVQSNSIIVIAITVPIVIMVILVAVVAAVLAAVVIMCKL